MRDFEEMLAGLKEDLEVPEGVHQRYQATLERLPEKSAAPRGNGALWMKRCVACAAAFVVLATTVYAAEKSGFLEKLFPFVGEEDAEKYLETGKEQETEIAVSDSYGPLWMVTESWYDSSTLYFWAEAPEAIVEDDSLEAYGKDHARVNGQDCLLNASEEYDEESQTYTGRFFCSIDLSNREVEMPMEVEIEVELTKNHNEVRIPYMIPPEADVEEYMANIESLEIQTIKFTVDGSAVEDDTVRRTDSVTVPIDGGEVVVEHCSLAPSKFSAAFVYRLNGAEAENRVEELWGLFYVKDAYGNELPVEGMSVGDPYQEEGDFCRRFEIEMSPNGLDLNTTSVTLTPYLRDIDADGKTIPGTEKRLENGAFTVGIA
jgi:hypothetical protein